MYGLSFNHAFYKEYIDIPKDELQHLFVDMGSCS